MDENDEMIAVLLKQVEDERRGREEERRGREEERRGREDERIGREDERRGREEERRGREEVEARLEQVETLLEQERRSREEDQARLSFRDGLNRGFESLEKLLELCDRGNYPSIPHTYIDNYCGAKSDEANASTCYINASESRVSDNQISLNNLQISKVRTKMLQGTESKLNIRSWELDDQDVIKAILECAVFDSENEMNIFITDQIENLDKLRRAIYFLYESTGHCCDEVNEFQPLFILFLEPFAALFKNRRRQTDTDHESETSSCVVKVECAQRVLLKGKLFIGDDTHASVDKIVRGHTDVIVFERKEGQGDNDIVSHQSESEGNNSALDSELAEMVCHYEVKSPCGVLHHPKCFREKDQLLIESEIIGQMLTKENNSPSSSSKKVLGGLTDLFAIAIMVRVPASHCRHVLEYANGQKESTGGPSNSNSNIQGPISFISHRIVHPRAFILRVMLLLGNYDDDQWIQLLSRSHTLLELNDYDEEEEEEKEFEKNESVGENPGPPPAPTDNANIIGPTSASTSASKFRGHGRSRGNDTSSFSFYSDNHEEKVEESTRRLLQWDCKRRGLAYLSKDELNRRNEIGPQYVSKFFLNEPYNKSNNNSVNQSKNE